MSLQTATREGPAIAPDLLQRLRKRLADSPALGWLRPSLDELGPDTCVLRLPYRAEVTNGSGTVHGGVLATLADTAIAFALATNFDGKMGFATADLTIHYLRPVPEGSAKASARVVRAGRRVVTVSAELFDAEGKLAATAISTYLRGLT